ncbi:amidohydrolase [Talaromyces pinophilus]|uniref:Amidohydrolase n=1 Tax=Talaromyces pinophilus TaxID=128442 RepID=A0A510NWJ3_TALPI|nr:amidohydrolase [Talaromyces pinophilus]
MALNRTTSMTIKVKRLEGKIALEEAVGSPYFVAHGTHPPTPMIAGMKDGLPPYNIPFLNDIDDRLNDVGKRLESMNASGIGYSIVSLTCPGVEGILNPDEAVDLAKKTNDAIYNAYVKAHPTRFGFFASVPMQKPKEAAKELMRAVKDLGAKGVLINGFTNMDPNDLSSVRYLDDPECEPFWQTLSELNVPLYLHPRIPPLNQQRIYESYPNLSQAAYGFGVETAGHSLRIICSGILDRYPNVQIILGHCAESLPFLAHRIDHRMAIGVAGNNGPYKKSVMYYLQNNFYATLAGVRRESTMRNTLDEMGEGRVLFSVDYPYESNEDAADWFDGLQLNENTRREVAWGNAKRLFNLQ